MYETMDVYIADFSKHIRSAIEQGKDVSVSPLDKRLDNIIVAGLGGSGIGGAIVNALVGNELKVPVMIISDYNLPNFVNEHTLVLASSYSGNTEETLSMFEQALQKGARIISITTNGKLAKLVDRHHLDCVKIASGVPPRGALALSYIPQLYILNKLGLISTTVIDQLIQTADFLDNQEEEIKDNALALAGEMHGTIPFLYATTQIEALVIRFRQQINENGKMLASHHVIPEMNHNELVGWRQSWDNVCAVFLKDADDYPRNVKRLEIVKEIAANYARNIVEINSKGRNRCERLMYLVHLTDWITYYLAQLNQVDAVEVNVIDYLKGELAKL